MIRPLYLLNLVSVLPYAVGFCDYTKRMSTLAELDDYTSPPKTHIVIRPEMLMPSDCVAYHTLRTLIGMMDEASANYSRINDGYDDLFRIYKDYMHDSIPGLITDQLMFTKTVAAVSGDIIYKDGPGMKYFDCTINGRTTACPDRKVYVNEIATPVVYKLRDANGFNSELAKFGLSPDWLAYGDSFLQDVHYQKGETYPSPKHLQHFPIRNDSMVVPNPKDIVTSAMKNVPSLHSDMVNTANEIMLQQWSPATVAAPAQVYSVPVFIMVQAIDNMAQAKKAAQDIKAAEEKAAEEKKKDIILLVLSLILIFVPVVGQELATAAGLATLARSIAIFGELGNGAMAVYDTVQHPESAIVNVLGSLFGLAGLAKVSRTEKGLSDLAGIRATIKPETIKNFGPLFESNNARLQTVLTFCRR